MARVAYELADSIATITLDDGKKNALSLETFGELGEALDRAGRDRAVVLLTGRDGAFSGGFDLRVLGGGGATAREMVRTGFELAERLLGFTSPVVIACTGHAIAMGAFLLLAGDHSLGALGDFKVGANEVALGLTMPFFAIEMCRQRLAPAYFHRAVINAEIFTPEAAVHAGFLDEVVAPEELSTKARAVAARLAQLDFGVHHATKLRARGAALSAIRAAIEADDSAMLGRT